MGEEWPNRIKGYEHAVDPASLQANPLNPRRHPGAQRDMIRHALSDVGWVAPVIVNDRTGNVIDGHMRIEEAITAGRPVPVVYVDISQVDEERVLASFDSIGYRAAYDRDVLDRLLIEVGDIGNDPLEALLADLSRAAVHFDDKPLTYTAPIPDHGDYRYDGAAGPVTVSYTDAAPAATGDDGIGDSDLGGAVVHETVVSRPGDRWEMAGHVIVCGDALDPSCYPEAAHLIVSDPPYFQKVDEEWDDQWAGFGEFLEFIGNVIDRWAAVLHDRGTVAMFCAADYVYETEQRFRREFGTLNHVVWFKGHDLGQAVSVDDMRRWRPRSERILIGERRHSPDELLAAFSAKTGHIAARSAYADIRDLLCRLRDDAGLSNRDVDAALGTVGMAGHYFGASQWSLPHEDAWATISGLLAGRGVAAPVYANLVAMRDSRRSEFDAARREFDAARRENGPDIARQLTDVWEMPAPSGAERFGHASPKPVDLVAKIVTTCARPGDVVLDTFGGTGPTLIAAHMRGAVAHVIEKDPRFVDVMCRRFRDRFGVVPVRVSDAATFPDGT